ncbi:hypothetical protein [Massilia mucilaginosa]|uniref:hypothetical protein n=1 Tax=Massilia mucilaginosa TaxID=2609282 RepID=UPI0014249EEF|nr:hypothetical protein [Massilia mucilaginosa]
MSAESSTSPIVVPRQSGLITPHQASRALAHPRYGELAGYPALADHLVWLVLRGILDVDRRGEAGDEEDRGGSHAFEG